MVIYFPLLTLGDPSLSQEAVTFTLGGWEGSLRVSDPRQCMASTEGPAVPAWGWGRACLGSAERRKIHAGCSSCHFPIRGWVLGSECPKVSPLTPE